MKCPTPPRTVDLDLLDVSLLLANAGLLRLGVDDQTDGGAVLLSALDLLVHLVLLVLLGVLGEGLLLGLVPVGWRRKRLKF